MSRNWNGKSLVDELSETLGDTSPAFKNRVLSWLNDTILNISSRHDIGHHLTKGKKILFAGNEIHNLEVNPPPAPTLSLKEAGNLAENVEYRVLLTYVQPNGVETIDGEPTQSILTSSLDRTIVVSNLPTSDESGVELRNVYLSRDGDHFYFVATLKDNTLMEYEITNEPTSKRTPPDYESIRRLYGSPFFEGSASTYLEFRDIDQLRKLVTGSWSQGTPNYFSLIESNSITTYPIPGTDIEASFNYYRMPHKLYYSIDSRPDLPQYFKDALFAGVISRGYEYRDRSGQEVKRANFENILLDTINRGSRIANIEYSVRDVYGNFDGFEVN